MNAAPLWCSRLPLLSVGAFHLTAIVSAERRLIRVIFCDPVGSNCLPQSSTLRIGQPRQTLISRGCKGDPRAWRPRILTPRRTMPNAGYAPLVLAWWCVAFWPSFDLSCHQSWRRSQRNGAVLRKRYFAIDRHSGCGCLQALGVMVAFRLPVEASPTSQTRSRCYPQCSIEPDLDTQASNPLQFAWANDEWKRRATRIRAGF
jgi:hypothetical protein